MSEATIDEMLVLLDAAFAHLVSSDLYVDEHYDGTLERTNKAIREILEQHRNHLTESQLRTNELKRQAAGQVLKEMGFDPIRAFVARIENRWQEKGAPYWSAIDEELAAMENDEGLPPTEDVK